MFRGLLLPVWLPASFLSFSPSVIALALSGVISTQLPPHENKDQTVVVEPMLSLSDWLILVLLPPSVAASLGLGRIRGAVKIGTGGMNKCAVCLGLEKLFGTDTRRKQNKKK